MQLFVVFTVVLKAVHKDEINDFHDHLNEQNADIQFTKEIEENGKLPFLDCLVSRDNNELRTTVYRKPTHTDRLLDESSYNPTSHKATTIRTHLTYPTALQHSCSPQAYYYVTTITDKRERQRRT